MKTFKEFLIEKPLFNKGEKVSFINRFNIKVKGTIVKFDEPKRRWIVLRDKDKKEIPVSPQNLTREK